MDKKLCFYVCQAYLAEVNQILKSGDYPDIRVMGYPNDCLSSPLQADKFTELFKNCLTGENEVMVVGSSCLREQEKDASYSRKASFHQLDYCAELIFSKELIEYYIEKRYYLVSSGWLMNYKSHLTSWGFEPSTAKMFFAEAADKILFLDTGIPGDFRPNIEAVSEYMGLPYEVLPIGLSHCKRLIDTLVFTWRERCERNRLNHQISLISRKAADYSMVFEQMQRLVDFTDENDIVREIFQLLSLLFAPQTIRYQPVFPDGRGSELFLNPVPGDQWNMTSEFLVIEARHQSEILGIFTLSGLTFPEYLEQYKSMRKVIGSLGGLAISNARKFDIIQKNEVQLRQYTQDLQMANANKDRFFSIIAHDLRSPFSAFLGLTEVMTDDLYNLNIDAMRQTGLMVHNRALILFSLLENLLEWSKIQMTGITVNPILLDLREIAQNELNLVSGSAQKKDLVLVNLIPEHIVLRTDRNMVGSIIRNLVTNAIKFSHPGGKVTISVQHSGKQGWTVSVKDSGIGMNTEILSHLFSLHEQANRQGTSGEPSTGLGLLLCKEFVEKLGGRIRVESEEGKGTVFFFSLLNIQSESAL